ncbi:hypothetical protein Tco_0199202 [Tanacetum coccineum]
MIATDSRIEDKKPSELILPPMDILETFPCVKDVDYITWDLAVSSVRFSTKAMYTSLVSVVPICASSSWSFYRMVYIVYWSFVLVEESADQ